ncbi:MAG: SH3 domain-containing protein [Aggregatilineales bacterium]
MKLPKLYCILLIMAGMLMNTVNALNTQGENLSAVMTVVADGVTVQRVGTDMEFALRVGAVMPLGAGDIVHTGDNGRVIIAFTDESRLFIFPQSTYELRDFSQSDSGERYVDSFVDGIAIQQFGDDVSAWNYRLETDALTVTRPSELFAVWAVAGRFEAAISAEGELTIQASPEGDPISMSSAQGVAVTYSETPFTLVPPYHAAQLLSLAIDCQGIIATNGSEGLRLRIGPALDYLVVRVLQDDEQVLVAGQTANELWLSIPYQTGFGWLFADLVETDPSCEMLPVYPDLVGNVNEQIMDVTEAELDFLIPFYGEPADNRIFYR